MLVTQTHGMGVDSTAWLTAVLRGDMPAGFDLADLTVVTAMTGDESHRTRWAMETFMLPLMRRHRVRYVQIARAGRSETDGIRVLDDSREPTRMHMAGSERLSDEMFRAGTIPQVSSRHCSYRFKGWVLDRWAEQEYGNVARLHVVGFAAEERRRIQRDRTYTTLARTPWYPLADDWGWDRDRCLAYLHQVYGIEWPRSCCGFCPFQTGDLARMRQRWAAEPRQARTAVAMERAARALNPRMTLFGNRSAEDLARRFGLDQAVDRAVAALDAQPASLYQVRRIHRRAGDKRDGAGWRLGPDPHAKATDVWRSLRTLATGTRAELLARLREIHQRAGGHLETSPQAQRLWLARASAPYPAVEHYLTIGVAGVADKQRPAFEQLWDFVTALDLPRQGDLLRDGQP